MELRDDFHQFFGIRWPGASPLAINILKKQVYNYLQQEILQIHHLHQEGQDPQLFSRPLHSFSKISWYLLTKSSKVTCKRSLCFCLTNCSGKCTMSRSQNARNATLLLNKTSQPHNRNHNLHKITTCMKSQLARNHNLHRILQNIITFFNATTCATQATNSLKSCHTFLLWPLGPLRPQILWYLATHFHSDHLGH